MAKYFKIREIERDDFIDIAGGDLDCNQLIVPVGRSVYVAIDEDDEYEINIPLECFE